MSQSNRFTNLGDGVYRHYNAWQTKGTSKGKYDMSAENALWDKTGVDPRASKTDGLGFYTGRVYPGSVEHPAVGIDIDTAELQRAAIVLSGIPNGIYRAAGNAMKRAAEHGRTIGMKSVAERYTAGINTLRNYSKIGGVSTESNNGYYEVAFQYRGFHIPLMRFDTKVGKDGRVLARVMRNGTQKALNHAFIGKASGNAIPGVFERIGKGRYPIRQLYGPSAIQGFYNDDTQADVAEAIQDKFDQRLEQEMYRLLNGYGGR